MENRIFQFVELVRWGFGRSKKACKWILNGRGGTSKKECLQLNELLGNRGIHEFIAELNSEPSKQGWLHPSRDSDILTRGLQQQNPT